MAQPHARYEFGDFVLDLGQQCLLRRDTGASIPLTSKVYETLVHLVRHAGEALDKESLLRAIWPNVIVEENSLAQNISTLRQLLGETRGENRYIATISRRGYRFVAIVNRVDVSHADIDRPEERELPTSAFAAPAVAPPVSPLPALEGVLLRPAVRPHWVRPVFFVVLAGALVALLGSWVALGLWRVSPVYGGANHTLAILPFRPLVPAERNESLELGMAESLIATLGEGREHLVRPLSSVRRFTADDTDPLVAGRQLGVDSVLDGSLQRSGDQLRVSVRLLRVADGQQLWAQTFDQDFTGLFEVQDAISGRVAQALPAFGAVAERQGRMLNPEAYALYASGRFAWTRQNEASLRDAIAYFEQAIALDPNYALAYTGLADSFALLGVFGIEAPNNVFPRALTAAQRALEIDPDLAAGHSALGHIKAQYEHDWMTAVREYERAIRIDPSIALTHHRRGLLHAMQGNTDQALASSARAQEREPLWLAARGASANYLYYARRHAESITLAEQMLALDERLDNARGFLIRNLIAIGDGARALEELDKGALQMPGSYAFRAQALATAGRVEEAQAELERVMTLSTRRYVAAYDIAMIHAALGDAERALTWLENAMTDRSTLLVFLPQDPAFDMLHADPRFAALVKRIGIYRRRLHGVTP